MSDQVVYGKAGQDVVVQAPAGHTLTTVSEDAAHTRVRFRPTAVPESPPPPEPPSTAPGSSGPWFLYTAAIAAVTKSYRGTQDGKLGSWLAALPKGAVGLLDFDTILGESFDITLADGVQVYAAPGKRPWVDGGIRLRSAGHSRLFGLSSTWSKGPTDGHMVKLDGGSIDYGHCELRDFAGYTLLRPGQTLHDSEIHHVWAHDNPGPHGDQNQDHAVYASGENPAQALRIHHSLLERTPHGRGVKIGGPSAGAAIGGIVVDHCTLADNGGPSNGQVSNGATKTDWHHLVLIGSGKPTALTEGANAGPGNTYHDNVADRPAGPGTANFKASGPNLQLSLTELRDYAWMGQRGYGHLAP